ncbi:hypothetical protein ABIA19_002143 [Sinorhizobium fredii]
MALHLIKLCVGADSVEDLREWVSRKALAAIAAGLEPHSFHTTRMVPKRTDDLLGGGSLYWVIKGYVQARQPLIGIETFTDGEGIGRCNLILGPQVVETELQPRRAFQGVAVSRSKGGAARSCIAVLRWRRNAARIAA